MARDGRWFDALLSFAKSVEEGRQDRVGERKPRTRIEHFMKDPPPPLDKTAIRHAHIVYHIVKEMTTGQKLTLTPAIVKVCRDFGISERTAWNAWTAYRKRQGPKPKPARNKF